MIVAFEGIDGSGKTTTAPLVAEKLALSFDPVIYTTKRDSPLEEPFAREQLQVLADRLWRVPHDARLDTVGVLHWIYLNAAFFAGIHYALTLQVGHDALIVIDNWINKFLAKITYNGEYALHELVEMLRPLPQPDMVFLLDVDPAVAAERKLDASDLERGAHHGDMGFAAYQTSVRENLRWMADRLGWTVVTPGDRSPDEIADEVVNLVCARMRRPRKLRRV